MAGNVSFSLTQATALFKINYYKRSENMYNSANVTQGRVKKRFDFTGRSRVVATSLSFAGGVGSGTIPKANVGNYQEATILSKKVYAVVLIDRESIKASMDDKGAFVKSTRESVQKTVESYNRNSSRILFSDGLGLLALGDATGAAVTGLGTVGSPFIVEIPLKTGIQVGGWKEANWEEKDYVQVVTGATPVTGAGGVMEADLLEIVAVDATTRLVSLVGTSARLTALVGGVIPLATTDAIAMQGSYENDPEGLKSILDKTAGAIYGIAVQRRWMATAEDALGAGITVDLMNKVMLDVEKKFGKAPNLIVESYVQFRKTLNLLEDQKQYTIDPRSKDLKGKVSFKGVEFMSSMGSVGVFPERFVEDDRVYFLNDNHIEVHHRPDFGWFDDDGTVFLRTTGDEYEARYGGYYQNYIEPTAHGFLHSLAV